MLCMQFGRKKIGWILSLLMFISWIQVAMKLSNIFRKLCSFLFIVSKYSNSAKRILQYVLKIATPRRPTEIDLFSIFIRLTKIDYLLYLKYH